MPNLNATIGITDNLTTPLRNMANAISSVTANIGDIATASGKLDPKKFSAMQSAAQQLDRSVSELEQETQKAANAQNKHNKSMQEGEGHSEKLSSGFKSLAGAVAGVVAGYASWQTLSAAVDLSDTLSQTTSRLNLINDGMQTTGELQQQIFEAAQNSRGSYQDMADLVSKLGTNAKDAFSSNDEMVRFAEQLNKQFVLAGASADEMAAASLQLTQGLASGTLRGDELNSVMEQAPTVIQTIADSLGVSTGEIRNMAAEGQITADVVKNALLGATDETNAKFAQMSLTFDQVWTNFKNQALMSFQPVLESINGIANNPALMEAVNKVSGVIGGLGPAIASVVDSVGSVVPVGLNAMIDSFQWIVDNANMVAAGLFGIASAVTAVAAANKIQSSGGIKAMFSGLGESLSGILALITPMNLLVVAIAGVAAAAVYLTATGTSLMEVSGFFQNFQSSVMSAVSNITNGIGTIAEGIAETFPTFASQLGAMIPTIVEGILGSAMSLIDAGAQIAVALLNGIMTALPSLVSGGISMVTNIISGIISMIPSLAEQAFVIVENFMAALSENLPNMLQKGGEAILAFVNGIYAQREVILQAGISSIVGFVQTVAEHIPTLIQRGAELIGSLIQGIVAMLPSLAATAISLIAQLGMNIIQNLPQIIAAGFQIVVALAQGLISAIPAILSGLGTIFVSFFSALAEYGPQILSAAGEVATNLWNGFVGGLSAGWENLTSFLSDTFNNVISFVKGIFGIASPSTVFADIGGFLMEGLGNGIQTMWDGISSVVGSIGGAIKDLLTPDVDYAQMIENTRNQINQLQADVQAGYDTIKSITLAQGQEMANGTVAIYGAMTGQILEQIGTLASQINGLLAGISGSFVSIFDSIRAQTVGYLITLSGDAVAQTNAMISGVAETLAGLTGIFAGAFVAVTGSVIAQLQIMQANAIVVLSGLTGSAIAVLVGLSTNAIMTINAMSGGFIGAILAMSTTTTAIVTAMAGTVGAVITGLHVAIIAEALVFSASYVSTWDATRALISQTVTALSNDVRSQITTLVNSILTTMQTLPPEFQQIGIDMMGELKDGIVSQTQAVVDVTNQLVQKLKNVFITGLGIHSPSAVMRYYAEMAGAGWIEGLTSSQMVSFTQSVMEDMKSSFKDGKFEPAQLVQYLDEDTLKVISYLNETGDATTAEQGGYSAGTFTNPLIGGPYEITSWFGPRPASDTGGIGSTNHGGIDIGAPLGTQIVAALPGTVSIAGWYGGYGNAVEIDHGGGLTSLYGHMSAVQTSVGATVNAGQAIGLVGSTGNSTGPHLHLSMFQNGTAIDPYPYYAGAASISGAQMTLATVIQNAYNQAKGIVTTGNAGSVNWDPNGDSAQWTNVVLQALSILGQPTSLLGAIMATLQKESSGNPNAINLTDSNAMRGTPSKGLMQVIDPTFATYALPGYNTNIWDPLSNILASLNYQLHTYGGIEAHLNGYASGTSGAVKGLHWVGENGPELLQFAGGERVFSHTESLAIANGLGGETNETGFSVVNLFDPSLSNAAGIERVSPQIELSAIINGLGNTTGETGFDFINPFDPLSFNIAGTENVFTNTESLTIANGLENGNDGTGFNVVNPFDASLFNAIGGERVFTNNESLAITNALAGGTGPNIINPFDPLSFNIAGAENVSQNTESLAIANRLEGTTGETGFGVVNPFDTSLFNIDVGASEGSFVDPGSYVPANGGTTNHYTTQAPINFRMEPTINTREEFDLSISEVEHKMTQALRNVAANNGAGLHH